MRGRAPVTVSADNETWLGTVLEALERDGCAVVTGVLSPDFIETARPAFYRVRDGILREIGPERLERAGELGVLRLPFRYDAVFFDFLEIPQVLQIVDATLGETAILHLLNAFALPSTEHAPVRHQNSFHRDFPRHFNGYLASLNTFFAIDEFTIENGATLVAPGTHQLAAAPDSAQLKAQAVPVVAPAGSMLVFDSTLWHCAGDNVSGRDRLALNMQFTRSFIKQQIDYVRALGDSAVQSLPPRSQQLLGWYTRVVTSLDEFYVPEEQRLYRRGQG